MNDKVDLIENAEFGYCSLIKATENILSRLDIEDLNAGACKRRCLSLTY